MDALVAETIITAQAELGSAAVSPIDTGRLRSSWFAAEGTPSNAEAPVGADSPNADARELRVDSNIPYHLTNNLPYAQAVALEGKVVSKSKNWFIEFVDTRIPKINEKASRVVKKAYDL
jgi:hypothetical protein